MIQAMKVKKKDIPKDIPQVRLIDEGNRDAQKDLAQVYINWSGYAYFGSKNEGRPAHETFRTWLAGIEIVMQNQDNREHDLLDSDDYYQFQGGMTASVTHEKGEPPQTSIDRPKGSWDLWGKITMMAMIYQNQG